jgi:hypothetical protein
MTNPTHRQAVIDGLRALVDLYERVPELPLKTFYGHGLSGSDADVLPKMDAVAEALRAAGVDFIDETLPDQRRIDVPLGGITFYINHHFDAHVEGLMARHSYSDNVQVAEAVNA